MEVTHVRDSSAPRSVPGALYFSDPRRSISTVTPPFDFGRRIQGLRKGALAFLIQGRMRTAIYIDGFNLYYRALKRTSYRWLDLLALSKQLVRAENCITLIRYFTARVQPNKYNPDQHTRQEAYLQAIHAHIPCLKIHEGQFYRNVVRMPLARPTVSGPRTIEVIKSEEKGSDVNLAVHLLNDAWENVFDVAVVISNDSDLAEGIRLARRCGKPIGVANPHATDRMNYGLYNVASFRRRIEHKHLKAAQLPNPVWEDDRIIVKPARW